MGMAVNVPLDTLQASEGLEWSAAPLLELHMSDEAQCVFCELESQFQLRSQTCKSDFELRHVCPSAWNNSAVNELIFMKFGI
jgi:hypothetical protein